MRWWPRASSCRLNILYGGFIFRIGCLGEKKTCDLHDFLCILHETEWPFVFQSSTAFTIHQFISFSWVIVSFSATSLEKNEYVSQHTMRVSTCIFHVQIAESRPRVINNDLSHLGGYIYSIGLVKAVSESLQELVRAPSSLMLVTLNNVKRRAQACEIERHVPDYPSK